MTGEPPELPKRPGSLEHCIFATDYALTPVGNQAAFIGAQK